MSPILNQIKGSKGKFAYDCKSWGAIAKSAVADQDCAQAWLSVIDQDPYRHSIYVAIGSSKKQNLFISYTTG